MPRPRNGPPDKQFTKDLFYFHRHDPQVGPLSEQDWRLKFEAHIKSINDNSNPSWNTNFDMGRADPSVMYTSMNRTVSISFQVFAMNEEEHKNNHDVLLARLGRMTYPLYKSGYGYNGTHVLFQIGNLYKGYGVITSLTYNWTNDNVWIDNRPVLTDCDISIMILADSTGKRPSTDSRYFI